MDSYPKGVSSGDLYLPERALIRSGVFSSANGHPMPSRGPAANANHFARFCCLSVVFSSSKAAILSQSETRH
jgi:hypothetical protein